MVGSGHTIEIFKEAGLPAEVYDKFDLDEAKGTHIIGHTRMATESAVTTAGSHPFATGADLCLVHNGRSPTTTACAKICAGKAWISRRRTIRKWPPPI